MIIFKSFYSGAGKKTRMSHLHAFALPRIYLLLLLFYLFIYLSKH